MDEKGYVGAYMSMVIIGSVVEYVSGIVYVMVWLVCRFIWVVKMCWGLKAWVVHICGMVYATDLLFSPRAPVRLSICVKHAFGGQDPHLNS